jgi:mannosidase alpha-like ER degradation enhancer 2
MFQHAYDSYLRYAYPLDELLPLTCNGTDTWGSFSLSLIDALDTLLVMGNTSEFRRAYNLVITKPSFDIDVNTSVFEANIRVVGGLLSAHLLSPMADVPLSPGWPCNGPLLNMAHSLALRLLPAFDTPTGLPYGTINLRYGVPPSETPITCVACCSSFLIEFGTLSRLTGDPIFEQTALKSVHAIWQRRSSIGLPGNHINVITGQWTASDFSVGNYVDSYLEYLVKGGVLFGHGKLIDMFNGLLTSIDKYTNNNGWYIWVNKDNGKMTLPYFEALDAYWPGLLSLVGRVKQARLTNFNHFLVWKSLGTLPEILHIVNGVPTKGYEAYHLRPGSDGSP